MEKFIFFFLSVVFFVIYFLILRYVYNSFVPYTRFTNVLSLFIIIIVIIPTSVITADKTIKLIQNSNPQ